MFKNQKGGADVPRDKAGVCADSCGDHRPDWLAFFVKQKRFAPYYPVFHAKVHAEREHTYYVDEDPQRVLTYLREPVSDHVQLLQTVEVAGVPVREFYIP